MNLILTHEQGDFDAVGALLAARLLDPEARAVLPRRLNRNVRAFLTLYGDRLPLTTFDELPRERIERVTLGDTQSLLVEDLEESAAQLDPVEATLLLTGIYEDTGSLSYSGTTPRDVRAVAWLLEQGASLTLAAASLNHPLPARPRP